MSAAEARDSRYTYTPSARVCALRERAMSRFPELVKTGLYREYHYFAGWREAADLPLALRNAEALSRVIERMPLHLEDGDLFAGEHFNGGGWNFAPHFSEAQRQAVRDSVLTPAEQAEFLGWMDEDPLAYQTLAPVAPVPEEVRLAQEHGVIVVWGVDLNHSIRGYEQVLKLGFSGLKQQAEAALAALPWTDPDAATRRANELAWIRLCEAAETLGQRHAEEARRQAEACADPALRAEWEALAQVCEQVPTQPARGFREALQALWFAHMITCWEDGVNANGLGRLDQFLWPYLERDLAEGRLTWEQAAELLAALWVKLWQPYDVQQMMLGGQTPQGADAVNPLSYLALAVTEGLGFVRCLSARLHQGSPREFVARCADLLARGGGIPFFFNDEALIPALTANGVPLEDARGYAAIGCIEITIPGLANPHAVSNWINLAKCLELALNDGRDLLDDTQLGPRTGSLAEFAGMDEVLAAYRTQVEHFAELAVYGSNAAEIAHRSQWRLPYLSLLTGDCVRRGYDLLEGGARYNYHSSAAMGVPNVADSLAALDQVVFGEQRLTGAELLAALREDFAGRDDLCQYLRNRVPKYGNDHALPDGYAAAVTRHYCETLGQYRTPSGGRFFVHLFTFTLMIGMGKLTAASAEGRRTGEPLAYSLSPVQGRDRAGLTAVLNSLSRLPHHLAAASSSAILEAHPSLLEGPGKQAFVDLLLTAIDRGVGQMQWNVVDAETLREAQQSPERFSNLCVRVSGFSQQFILLDPELQEHVIARTKHRE